MTIKEYIIEHYDELARELLYDNMITEKATSDHMRDLFNEDNIGFNNCDMSLLDEVVTNIEVVEGSRQFSNTLGSKSYIRFNYKYLFYLRSWYRPFFTTTISHYKRNGGR